MNKKKEIIIAIDTSCDETSAAIVCGRCVLSSVVYSQILIHKKWGGVMPQIAKRAHEERIDGVVEETFRKARRNSISNWKDITAIAVTYGPGLAIALGVGIDKAIELSKKHKIPLIGVNHMEGHLYSPFVQNSKGSPDRDFQFPYLGLLVSGAHTEIVLFKNHLKYEILGETRDDACGEALDKAARMLGFGYPGGPILERLAVGVDNVDRYRLRRPMIGTKNLDFSFSGLKTSFLYFTKAMSDSDKLENISFLASSFQEAVFTTLVRKTMKAMKHTGVNSVLVGGGVAVNHRLRTLMRRMVKEQGGVILFPSQNYLNFDNAAMIGLVGAIRAERKLFAKSRSDVERVARLSLLQSSIK